MSIHKRMPRGKGGGTKRYVVFVDCSGGGKRKRQYIGSFRTRTEARAQEREAITAASRGNLIAERIKVHELMERYMERCKSLSPTTIGRYQELVKTINASIGSIPLSKLTSTHCKQLYASARSRGLSAKTIRGHLHGVLSAAINWGMAEDPPLCFRNVARSARRDLEKPRRSPARALSTEEAHKLLAASPYPWQAFWLIGLCCGLRRGESAAIRWADVDFEKRVLHVERSFFRIKGGVGQKAPKNGEPRDVPLNDAAIAALKSHRALQAEDVLRHASDYDRDGDLVFCDPLGQPWSLQSISNAFHRIATEAGLKGVRLHDLRHSAASWLIADGVDIQTVSAVVGHKSSVTTLSVYSHLMPNATAKAVELIAKRLASAG